MDYGLLNLGSEKLVARYVGPAEWMAFNESVLRESLASLQGQSWGARELVPEKLEWSATRSDADGRGILPVPAGWMVTSSGPSRCPGLPQPATVSTALPADDFAFALRAAAWPAGDVVPEAAAARCSSRRGSLGAASYVTRAEWLGVPYVIEGVFALIGPGQVVQLEVSSTDDKTLVARALLAAWLQRAAQ